MLREYVKSDDSQLDYAAYAREAKEVKVGLLRSGDDVCWNVYVNYLDMGPDDLTEFHFKADFLGHDITKQEAEWLASGRRATFYVAAREVYGDDAGGRLLVVVSLHSSGLMTEDGNELLLVTADEFLGEEGGVNTGGLRPLDDRNGKIVPCTSQVEYDHRIIFGMAPRAGEGYATSRSLLRELVSGLHLRIEEDLAAMRADVALPSYYMQSLSETVKVLDLCLKDGERPSVHELYKVAGLVFKYLCRLGDHGCASLLNDLTRSHLEMGLESGEVVCDGEEDEEIVEFLGL